MCGCSTSPLGHVDVAFAPRRPHERIRVHLYGGAGIPGADTPRWTLISSLADRGVRVRCPRMPSRHNRSTERLSVGQRCPTGICWRTTISPSPPLQGTASCATACRMDQVDARRRRLPPRAASRLASRGERWSSGASSPGHPLEHLAQCLHVGHGGDQPSSVRILVVSSNGRCGRQVEQPRLGREWCSCQAAVSPARARRPGTRTTRDPTTSPMDSAFMTGSAATL